MAEEQEKFYYYSNPDCNYRLVPDFDNINSTDCRYLQPGDHYPQYTDGADDNQQVPVDTSRNDVNFTADLVLVTVIFALALLANGSLTFVVNMTLKKTLRQKLLVSALTTTCIIRASVNFIRYIYIVAFVNHWQFNIVICRADAFLDHFSTAVFPYVLIFLVYDSTKIIMCHRCHSNSSRGNRLKQSSPWCNLFVLVGTFLCVLSIPVAFAILLTVMTTTHTIAKYGEGKNALANTTVCQLNINFFESFTPFKTYITFHALIWLICVPVTIILIIYFSVSVISCVKKCKCLSPSAYYENNNQIILEDRDYTGTNWFVTILLLSVVYALCLAPYEILTVLMRLYDIPVTKAEVMIVYLLFYAPPAMIPLVFCFVDKSVRKGYRQHVLYCYNRGRGGLVRRQNDWERDSYMSTNSICSSTMYAKSDVTSPLSHTTCTSIGSLGSELYNEQYVANGGEETIHIVESSPDLSNCSSHEECGNGCKAKGKAKRGRGSDNEDDCTPILVTSL